MKKVTSLEAFMNLTGDQVAGNSKQLKALEILLQQNAQLEQEIERLNRELDELTAGVQKKGYLHKWREREIYYASRWGLRYIALQGSKISYYGSEHESHPRRVIDLSNCFVRDEGKKRSGSQVYHIFSIYLGSAIDDAEHDQDSSGGNLLLRLSTESSAEAILWIDMLERACSLSYEGIDDTPLVDRDEVLPLESELLRPHTDEASDFQFEITNIEGSSRLYNSNNGDDDVFGTTGTDTSAARDQVSSLLVGMPLEVPSAMLQRVKSSTEVLKRSLSRPLLPKQSRVAASRMPSSHTKGRHHLNPSAALTATIALKGSESEKDSTSKGTGTGKSKTRTFPAYKPMHLQAQPSPLSPDTGHGDHNFRGFFNLGVIILALSHVELIINNLYQVGLKVSWLLPRDTAQLHLMSDRMASPTVQYVCLAVSCWLVSFSLSFAVEKAAATYHHYISETVVLVVYILLGTFSIVAPCMFVWHSEVHVGASMAYLFQSVILWMKLISYAHANHDLRVAIRKAKRLDKDSSTGKPNLERTDSHSSIRSDTQDNNAKPYGEQLQLLLAECKDLQPPFVLYPQNITISNLLYFSIAPTLCYQLNYPRSPSIRWTNVLFLLFRLVFVGAMILFSVEQYIFPHLESIVTPMADRNVLRIVEKVLKLSIPNTYIWLLVFYFYFHLWLNLLAELTRFGDRQFYKEWYEAAIAPPAFYLPLVVLLCA